MAERALTRRELTAALAVRQLLLERARISPADAITRLTPLQAQHAPAPYVALAARLDGFDRDALEAAFARREVLKTTIMRRTLHAVAAREYPAYAQVARQTPLRALQARHAQLDLKRIEAELRAFLREPRTNSELRDHLSRREGMPRDEWGPVLFARTLLPLVALPPAGAWGDRGRSSFVIHDEALPPLPDAAAHVLGRYLTAFGPASLRDAAAWAGAAQRDFAGAPERLGAVTYRGPDDTLLLDLPGAPVLPADTQLPVRLLARWDQALLAHADRERIMPPEVAPLKLTLSGDATVTVDGRVAASWGWERAGRVVRLAVTPHVTLRRGARAEIRAEARRTARICYPDAGRVEVGFA